VNLVDERWPEVLAIMVPQSENWRGRKLVVGASVLRQMGWWEEYATRGFYGLSRGASVDIDWNDPIWDRVLDEAPDESYGWYCNYRDSFFVSCSTFYNALDWRWPLIEVLQAYRQGTPLPRPRRFRE